MPSYFAQADLIVCRSGASTVAEITAAGKPAVFVPFPRAADDHQKRNAEALERAGAAVMLEESNLNRDSLANTVANLFTDKSRLTQMGETASKLAHPHAAQDIAIMAKQLTEKTKSNR
jgi:UDP-N-acetylglucosamine--N-acetylmuramyl-(pentapeptide) pyrophosphoryl-undecaprenol N-acetylglucosamine transferase